MNKIILMVIAMTLAIGASAELSRPSKSLVASATPKLSHATPDMVAKSNTLANQLSAPAMKMAKVNFNTDFHEFFKTHDMKDNMIKRPNASGRITAENFLGTKVIMLDCYDWEFSNEACQFTPSTVEYVGGWESEITESDIEGCVTVSGIYYNIPVDMVADYANETVTMYTGEVIYSYLTERGYHNRKYQDTLEYVILVNEDWLSDGPMEDIVGEIMPDGSVYIENGWAYLFFDVINTYSSRTSQTATTSDTSLSMSKVYRDTYFMTPNARHTFVNNAPNLTGDASCYMWQYDDTTAIIWNIFGKGYRGVVANISEDGNMEIPIQVAAQVDVHEYAEQYTQYDWTGAQNFYLIGYDLDTDEASGPIVGTNTNTQIKWGGCTLGDFVTVEGSQFFCIYYQPWSSNEINFLPGYGFTWGEEQMTLTGEVVFGEVTADGKIHVQYTGSENVSIQIIDQDANLYTQDENGDIQLPGHGEYTIIVTVTAAGYNPLEASTEVTWAPAQVGLRGDCNLDGIIDPRDVSALIDYLMNDAWSN